MSLFTILIRVLMEISRMHKKNARRHRTLHGVCAHLHFFLNEDVFVGLTVTRILRCLSRIFRIIRIQ